MKILIQEVLGHPTLRSMPAHYLPAKHGAAGVGFVRNFAVRRQLLFVRRRAA
jgi:hypothetical protein